MSCGESTSVFTFLAFLWTTIFAELRTACYGSGIILARALLMCCHICSRVFRALFNIPHRGGLTDSNELMRHKCVITCEAIWSEIIEDTSERHTRCTENTHETNVLRESPHRFLQDLDGMKPIS
ncbi:hypothetical protein WN51_08200 [Melipona quadrifasciata]|uniref:Secreted protein n=1 Tax=Melipona quadrifasciata TaxID=166423 RepID=A0A0M8ZN54_9HYME|nr:hypothetical protein WN51_08200 [Melipona quadrifasciata]